MIAQLTRLALISLIALAAWSILRRSWQRRSLREAMVLLFLAYMTGILCLALEGQWDSPGAMLARALERMQTGERISLQPLRTIGKQLQKLPTSTELQLTQLLGNTLLFIPWGFCLPLLWRRFRKPLRMIAMCLLLTCGIELTQLFIAREVDVDDVLLNFLGSATGAGLWWLLHRTCPKTDTLAK